MANLDSKAILPTASTEKNYTPLVQEKVKRVDAKKLSKINTILLIIAVITAVVLAYVLIALIRTTSS